MASFAQVVYDSTPTKDFGRTKSDSAVSNIFAWGSNVCGQIGLSEDEVADDFIHDPMAISLRGITKITSIACGKAHTLIVTEMAGDVYAMGDNTYGQLGVADEVG